MANYKQPRKFNPVSAVILAVLLALVYGAVQFGPSYWRKWKVKEIVDGIANKCVSIALWTPERMAALRTKSLAKIKAAGIKDPALRLSIESPGRNKCTVSAEYVETIIHPLVGQTTKLTFRPFIVLSK